MKLTSLLALTMTSSSLLAVDFYKDIKPILEKQCIKCTMVQKKIKALFD